jgi:uncharacterized membrane protein YukC
MTTVATTSSHVELSNDLIMLALKKIDDLVKSNSELSNGITQLNVVIVSLQSNWKDLKDELKQTRYDSKSSFDNIAELYKTLDKRLYSVEADKTKREILEEERENNVAQKERKDSKRFRRIHIVISLLVTALGVFHIPWKWVGNKLSVFF